MDEYLSVRNGGECRYIGASPIGGREYLFLWMRQIAQHARIRHQISAGLEGRIMKTVEKALRALTAEMVRMDLNRPLSDCPLLLSPTSGHPTRRCGCHAHSPPRVPLKLSGVSHNGQGSLQPRVGNVEARIAA
jgi:hypothetical protein